MAELTFTGTVEETTAASKGPHKVKITGVDNPDFTMTFRVWGTTRDGQGNDQPNPAWTELQNSVGKQVTVRYEDSQRQGPQGPYTQHLIKGLGAAANGSQGAPQPQGGAQWDEALERKRAALIASEVVKQLRSAGGWPIPEGAQQSAPADLPSETYDAFAKDAEAAGYGLPALDKQFAKLFPDDAFDGWRKASAEKLTKLAEALDFTWS